MSPTGCVLIRNGAVNRLTLASASECIWVVWTRRAMRFMWLWQACLQKSRRCSPTAMCTWAAMRLTQRGGSAQSRYRRLLPSVICTMSGDCRITFFSAYREFLGLWASRLLAGTKSCTSGCPTAWCRIGVVPLPVIGRWQLPDPALSPLRFI